MRALFSELIAVRSVSSDPTLKDECRNAASFLQAYLERLGATVEQVQVREDKNPVIIAKLGEDPTKPILTTYAHYDVQPAAVEDGWDSDPFVLTEKEGYLYGRGATDDKGPIVAELTAMSELIVEGELPINLRIIYEGEEESGSGGFKEAITAKQDWFDGTTGILITDNYWLGEEIPCLTYGLRGITYMTIEIEGPKQDLHSGEQGGVVQEPLHDLVTVLATLADNTGHVLIPDFYDRVLPLTSRETDLYNAIELDIDSYKAKLGVTHLQTETPQDLLMQRWRYPCLTIHGIEGAFSGTGTKTVIPGRVIGKVSMRTVPEQDPVEIGELFKAHVQREFEKLASGNRLQVETRHAGDWWLGDPSNHLFQAAEIAVQKHWGVKPIYTREGGSIPITPFLEKLFDAPAVLIAIGQSTDRAHSQNERIRIKNLDTSKDVLKTFYTVLGKP